MGNVLVFSEGIRPHVCDLGLPKAVEEMLINSFSPRIQDRPTMQIVCDTLTEERPNLVRLGITTTSSAVVAAAAATSYVTSCSFQSFSDHNPMIKKKMKMLRANNTSKNNNWNITAFKNGKNNNISSSNNKVRFSPFRRPVRLAK